MSHLRSSLDKLAYRPRDGKESKKDIADLELILGATLPEDYREFLLEMGSGYIDVCVMDCSEPTPFGRMNILSLASVAAINRLLDSDIVPRNMIGIGHGHFGMETCLSFGDDDFGNVYALDVEQRRNWSAKTLAKLPHLAPEIKEFFRLRDEGKLMIRKPSYEHCYHVAASFSEFVAGLQLVEPA